MAAMRWYENVMTTTKQQIWQNKINRVYCCCCRCILHLQQYSRRLNFFFFLSFKMNITDEWQYWFCQYVKFIRLIISVCNNYISKHSFIYLPIHLPIIHTKVKVKVKWSRYRSGLVGAELFHTDGRTDKTELIVAFFAILRKRPKIGQQVYLAQQIKNNISWLGSTACGLTYINRVRNCAKQAYISTLRPATFYDFKRYFKAV